MNFKEWLLANWDELRKDTKHFSDDEHQVLDLEENSWWINYSHEKPLDSWDRLFALYLIDVQGLDFYFNDPKYYQAEHNLYVVGNWEFLDDSSHEDFTLAGTSAPYKEYHRIKFRLVRIEIPNPMTEKIKLLKK